MTLGEIGDPAGLGQGLQHRHRRLHADGAFLLDLADQVDLLAVDLFNGDRDTCAPNQLAEFGCELTLEFVRRQSRDVHLSQHRQRDPSVGPYRQGGNGGVRFLPHLDTQHVARADPVLARVLLRILKIRGRRSDTSGRGICAGPRVRIRAVGLCPLAKDTAAQEIAATAAAVDNCHKLFRRILPNPSGWRPLGYAAWIFNSVRNAAEDNCSGRQLPLAEKDILLQFEQEHHLAQGIPIVLALLFIDLFSAMAVLFAIGQRANLCDREGNLPRLRQALEADSLAACGAATLGSTTAIIYLESAAGVEQGGRTGLVSISAAACFLLALIFTPVIFVIPSIATTPALVAIGAFMLQGLSDLDLREPVVASTALITSLMMALTSISDGMAIGFLINLAVLALTGNGRTIRPMAWALAALSLEACNLEALALIRCT